MIDIKVASIVVAAFVAGASIFASPVPQAIAAIIATDVQCTGCVGASDLASSAVTNGKIASSAVSNSKIASNAVTSAKIADGTIGYADVARGFIAQEHRDDCNCGGTGWDPDGISKDAIIFDSRITVDSAVVWSFSNENRIYPIYCSTTSLTGAIGIICESAIPEGEGINYAIIRNPAYG